MLILVTTIAITVCLVMNWNKRKASNSSSNTYQSNTQIRHTENRKKISVIVGVLLLIPMLPTKHHSHH